MKDVNQILANYKFYRKMQKVFKHKEGHTKSFFWSISLFIRTTQSKKTSLEH